MRPTRTETIHGRPNSARFSLALLGRVRQKLVAQVIELPRARVARVAHDSDWTLRVLEEPLLETRAVLLELVQHARELLLAEQELVVVREERNVLAFELLRHPVLAREGLGVTTHEHLLVHRRGGKKSDGGGVHYSPRDA